MNILQKIIYRGKRKCVRCNKWTSLDFVDDWCKVCGVEQSQAVLRQIGTIIAMRMLGRGVDRNVEYATSLVTAMPIRMRNKEDLQKAIEAATLCILPEVVE